MNRRQILVGAVSCCAGGLAGCASLFDQDDPDDHKPQLEVFVTNALERSIQVTITATRGSTVFFTQSYDLAPGEGDESQSFVGTPRDIRVSIQDGRTVTREYSIPASCDSPELNITIEPDDIMVTNGCVNS